MNDVIIYQPWGGLGDNLGHSPIPELCFNSNIKCYLSNQNAYRNPEIYDLIWGTNPYISGTRDSTDMSWLDKSINRQYNRDWNELKNIQCRYGFDPTHHYPQIYFKPNYIPELKEKTVINLGGYSIYAYQNFNKDINLENYNKCVEQLIEKYNLDNFVRLTDNIKYAITPNLPVINNITNTYEIQSLKHYSDIMFSCKNYICFNSGPSILACAIKNKYKTNSNIFVFNIEKLNPPTNYQCYVFKNATYLTIDTKRILEREE
jgi:hypothetical protein